MARAGPRTLMKTTHMKLRKEGQKVAARAERTLPDALTDKILMVSGCERADTGHPQGMVGLI